METTGNIVQSATGYLGLASGTTAERPSSPTNGMIRYNTSNAVVEGYVANGWVTFASAVYTEKQITGYDGSTSEPMLFVADPTRSYKNLSVTESTLTWQLNSLNNNDWFLPNSSLNSSAGYIVPYTGTIVRMSLYVGATNGATKTLDVYCGSNAAVGALTTGATGAAFVNSVVNIDFVSGANIRVQGVNGGAGTGSNLSYVTLTMAMKWRY